MDYKIVVDSSCDLTPELREKIGAVSIPLSLMLDGQAYTDDDDLDLPAFMRSMMACTGKIGSASPSPDLYKEAFSGAHTSFAVTLSGNLSGSYESAILGKNMAGEDSPADVHVFNSKSASAGEILIAFKIRNMIDSGIAKMKIISGIDKFIGDMKTYFVIENIDNLLKNGRLNKLTGKIISVLGIKPIMGADEEGNIALFTQARGAKQIIEKMTGVIHKSGKNTEGADIVITHCGNPTLAEKLADAVRSRFNFKNIIVLPTRGLSSLYVNDQGVIMAF